MWPFLHLHLICADHLQPGDFLMILVNATISGDINTTPGIYPADAPHAAPAFTTTLELETNIRDV